MVRFQGGEIAHGGQGVLPRIDAFGGKVLFCSPPGCFFSVSLFAGCIFSQREALLSALSNGERWRDAVSLVEAMLAKSLVVDNPTAGLAMKAYASLGLKEHWKSVGVWRSCGAETVLGEVVCRLELIVLFMAAHPRCCGLRGAEAGRRALQNASFVRPRYSHATQNYSLSLVAVSLGHPFDKHQTMQFFRPKQK